MLIYHPYLYLDGNNPARMHEFLSPPLHVFSSKFSSHRVCTQQIRRSPSHIKKNPVPITVMSNQGLVFGHYPTSRWWTKKFAVILRWPLRCKSHFSNSRLHFVTIIVIIYIHIVCLANLASYIITCNLTKKVWYACEKGANYVTATWRSSSGFTRLELRPLCPNGQAPRHWVKIEWIATSTWQRKHNITSKSK